jgi:hypothetical protein
MFAGGKHSGGLLEVKVIGRADVHNVDRRVVDQLVERTVAALKT